MISVFDKNWTQNDSSEHTWIPNEPGIATTGLIIKPESLLISIEVSSIVTFSSRFLFPFIRRVQYHKNILVKKLLELNKITN